MRSIAARGNGVECGATVPGLQASRFIRATSRALFSGESHPLVKPEDRLRQDRRQSKRPAA